VRSAPEIRVVGVEDWPMWRDIRLRALEESPSAFGATYADERVFPEQLWRARLGDPGAVGVLVLEDGAAVAIGAGYQDVPGFLHVVSMWVEPAARRRGLGRRVLGGIRQWADERGLRLHLDVVIGNARARRFYERYGFVGTGETRPLREGSTDLVERMVLSERPP
jgi:GNAT superfamily N-acetyltransferase